MQCSYCGEEAVLEFEVLGDLVGLCASCVKEDREAFARHYAEDYVAALGLDYLNGDPQDIAAVTENVKELVADYVLLKIGLGVAELAKIHALEPSPPAIAVAKT